MTADTDRMEVEQEIRRAENARATEIAEGSGLGGSRRLRAVDEVARGCWHKVHSTEGDPPSQVLKVVANRQIEAGFRLMPTGGVVKQVRRRSSSLRQQR